MLKEKSDIIAEFDKLGITLKAKSRKQIKAVKSDNAPEILSPIVD